MITSTGNRSSIPPPPSRRLVPSSNSCFSPYVTGGTRIGNRQEQQQQQQQQPLSLRQVSPHAPPPPPPPLQQQQQQQYLLTHCYNNYNGANDVQLQLTPLNRMGPTSSPVPPCSNGIEDFKNCSRTDANTPTTFLSSSEWSSRTPLSSPSFSSGWLAPSPSPSPVIETGGGSGTSSYHVDPLIVQNVIYDGIEDDIDTMVLVSPTATSIRRHRQSMSTTPNGSNSSSSLRRWIDFSSTSIAVSTPSTRPSSSSATNKYRSNANANAPPFDGITAGTATICTVIESSRASPPPAPEEKKNESRIKTEYCKFILNNQPCKFGKLCNFAHDETELNYKTLFERHDAGLLDKETLRTRPCFDYVSTGSCPFHTRCTSIHDPRIKTSNESKYKCWLPNCLLESKNLGTDVHIDWFRDLYFSDIHYGHGFGGDSKGSSVLDSFERFYNYVTHSAEKNDLVGDSELISNNRIHKSRKFISKGRKNCLTEAQRIKIELIMRFPRKELGASSATGSLKSSTPNLTSELSSTALFKYKPSHIIFNEMCMVLQKRAFDVSDSTSVDEISVDEYNRHNANHLLVYDIAFGLPGPSYSSGSNKNSINGDDNMGRFSSNVARKSNAETGCSSRSNSPLRMPTNGNNRPRALYFHICEEDIRECTLQERMNYKKTCKKLERLRSTEEKKLNNIGVGRNGRSSNAYYNFPPKSFDVTSDNFDSGRGNRNHRNYHRATGTAMNMEMPIIVNMPMDRDSFQLTTEVLKHRLSVLVQGGMKMEGTIIQGKEYKKDLAKIQEKFESLKLHLRKFCYWPVNTGRERADETTLVPNATGPYSVPKSSEKKPKDGESKQCNEDEFKFHEKIWNSFLENMEQVSSDYKSNHDAKNAKSRLEKYQKPSLSSENDHGANSCSTSKSRLHHITDNHEDSLNQCKQTETHFNDGENDDIFFSADVLNVNSPSSKSWKYILDGNTNGDWDLVRSFYNNKR